MRTTTKQRVAAVLTAAGIAGMTAIGQGAGAASADTILDGVNVGGRIEQAYFESGGLEKWGGPRSEELRARNNGRFQVFAKDTAFYWNAGVDYGRAHQISGAIRGKWASLRWENGALGYPVTNEFAQGPARVNIFQGGTIYWSPNTGAHQIWGGILSKWRAQGGVTSAVGLPVSDEIRLGNNTFLQRFVGGVIYFP
ncbi:LGFP repeat-containing protein [Williamsia sp. M5A3_1d]